MWLNHLHYFTVLKPACTSLPAQACSASQGWLLWCRPFLSVMHVLLSCHWCRYCSLLRVGFQPSLDPSAETLRWANALMSIRSRTCIILLLSNFIFAYFSLVIFHLPNCPIWASGLWCTVIQVLILALYKLFVCVFTQLPSFLTFFFPYAVLLTYLCPYSFTSWLICLLLPA